MNKIPVIIDVDTGIDDTFALLIAVTAPKLDVLAATATIGNTTVENAVQNTLNALAFCGRTDIPVAAGADRPWKKKLRTSPYIHGEYGIGDYTYPENHREALVEECAWDLSYRRILECGEKVTYIALGALTNLATLLRKYPDAAGRLDRIVYMGGELRGSTAGSQCASVNIFHDPEAAQYVLSAGIPFYMCTGSLVTTHVDVSLKEMEGLFSGNSEGERMVMQLFRYYFAACTGFGERDDARQSLHDPATVMFLIEPQCYYSVLCHCDVELEGKETYGYSLIDVYNIAERPAEEFNIQLVRVDAAQIPYLRQRTLECLKAAVQR